MILYIAILSNVNVATDTVVPRNMWFWKYSSCGLTSGVEVLAFYLSSDLSGGLPVIIGVSSGAMGCAVYSYSAYTLTPLKELKPKAFENAFKGGVLGVFGGLGLVLILKLANLM